MYWFIFLPCLFLKDMILENKIFMRSQGKEDLIFSNCYQLQRYVFSIYRESRTLTRDDPAEQGELNLVLELIRNTEEIEIMASRKEEAD